MPFDIPAQDLASALSAFVVQSRVQVLYEGSIAKGLRGHGLKGSYTPDNALRALLSATSLQARFTDKRTVTLEHKPVQPGSSTLGKVVVSGKTGDDPTSYKVTNASSATKTDTPIMETPVSIQVVPRSVMDDQQVISIQDAVKNVAGVQPGFSSGSTYNIFTIRGFNTSPGDTTESASVYREGMRLSGFRFPTANLDRVEVLKGPAAIMYGRIEPGGMINAVTKDAQATPYYSLQQQFGAYDLYRTSADATGLLTSDGSLLYRTNFEYKDSGSFRKGLFNRELDITPNLTWNPSDQTTIELEFEYHNQENIVDHGVPALGQRPANIPISRFLGDARNESNRRDDYLVDLDLTHRFNDDWKLQWKGTYAHTDRVASEIYAWGLNEATGDLNRFYYNENDDRNYYFTSLNLTGKFDTYGLRHTFLSGFDYYKQNVFSVINSSAAPGINIFDPVYNTTRRTSLADFPASKWRVLNQWYGIYLQDQVDLSDQLHVLLGGRYDNTDSVFDVVGAPINNKGKLNPRYGLVYQPWKWLSLYGHYVESIGVNNGRSGTGKAFSPETAGEWEGGVKTELLDGKIIGTVAYFDLTKQNILTPDPSNPLFNLAVGEARSRGVEVDVSGRVTDALSLIASYAHTDARITKDNSGNQGKRLPNAPLNSGSLWAKYAFQQEPLKGFNVGIGAYLSGQREGDASNSYQLPGYARLDAMAGYTWKVGNSKLTTQLNVNNFLDKQYYAASRSNRFWIQPGDPLTVMGSIRLEY